MPTGGGGIFLRDWIMMSSLLGLNINEIQFPRIFLSYVFIALVQPKMLLLCDSYLCINVLESSIILLDAPCASFY